MNFNQFVIRNTIRNKHLYLAYFLSTMFSVMIFFTFTGFVFHPALANGLNPKAQMGMTAAAIIIYGFSFLFVLYIDGCLYPISKKRVWNLDDSRDESKTVKENDFY